MSVGPNDPFGNGVLRWKQDVLRSMVEAQVFWSESTDYWTDAIKSLMESQTMRFGIGRLAALFLYKTMMATHKAVIDPVLYGQLAFLVAELFPERKDFVLAHFDLRHPVRPSTARFLKLLETGVDHDQHLKHWFNPKTLPAGSQLFHTLVFLAQRCLAEGHKANAERVLDIGYDHAPQLFSGEAGFEVFKNEVKNTVKPPPIPRKATPADIAAGKEVDADGNIIVSAAAHAYWEQTHRSAR
jgi:hypothetical protein